MLSYDRLTPVDDMAQTRMSTKGQVVIPGAVRKRHGWAAGTILEVEDREDGVLLKAKALFRVTTLDELIGCTGYKGPAFTVEEMDAAVAEMFRRQKP